MEQVDYSFFFNTTCRSNWELPNHSVRRLFKVVKYLHCVSYTVTLVLHFSSLIQEIDGISSRNITWLHGHPQFSNISSGFQLLVEIVLRLGFRPGIQISLSGCLRDSAEPARFDVKLTSTGPVLLSKLLEPMNPKFPS